MRCAWLAKVLLALLVIAPVALMGCSGDDGKNGAAGPPGTPGDDGDDGLPASKIFTLKAEQPESLVFTVDDITIASPPVVNFTLKDGAGRLAVDLGSYTTNNNTRLGWVRFSMAKLVPGTSGGPDQWIDYVNGERIPSKLVDHGDGTYTYTFDKDLGAYNASYPYEPMRTHRFAIQSSGGAWNYVNLTYDFVPSQLPGPFTLPLTRDVVTTAACNDCHGELVIHGSRFETKYCVVCHNPTLGDGDMTVMVHAIHAAGIRTNPYELAGEDYSHIGYPQDLRHCTKCHDGTDADNFKTRPSRVACGSCHDDVDFATGIGHAAQANDLMCSTCHPPEDIVQRHITDNPTEHSLDIPEGAVNFTYEIAEVTIDGNGSPIVKFRILRDGVPAVFNVYDSQVPGLTLLNNFTGAPSFLVAFYLPQDGVDEAPADYNNFGKKAGQPASVSLENIWKGTQGTLTGPDGSGYYTALINGDKNAGRFPPGATLRAVGLNGYFTQVTPAVARHTISVVKELTGDPVRRRVVDNAKCADCHEWFEGHGGNRVYEIAICTLCHLPNLSTSGRAANLSSYVYGTNSNTDATIDHYQAVNGDGTNVLLWDEDTNNLKDMIHGIHAAHMRTDSYEFVRDRTTSGRFYYDWSHVTFPGALNSCETCHLPGTYELDNLPANLLATNTRTTSGDDTTYSVVDAARSTVPNATDLVNSPQSSACYYCHDSEMAVAHMEQNGGAIRWPRGNWLQTMPTETCIVCHGEGKIADVNLVHSDEEE